MTNNDKLHLLRQGPISGTVDTDQLECIVAQSRPGQSQHRNTLVRRELGRQPSMEGAIT